MPTVQASTVVVGEAAVPRFLTLTGSLSAFEDSDVAAGAAGKVLSVHVERGSLVKKGDVLVRLDSRAASASAAEARAQVELARTQKELAEADCARNDKLFEGGSVSAADHQRMQAQCRNAAAQAAAAEARLSLIETNLSDTTIRAPFDGVVTRRLMEVGEFASPGRAVIAVHDPASLRAVGSLPQFVLAATARIDRATVDIPSIGKTYPATRVTVLPASDPRLLSTQVRADLPNLSVAGLTPGMAAKVLIPIGKATRRVVPENVLIRRGELTAVNVKTPQNEPQLRQVRVGPSVHTADGQKLVEVLAGLTDGEQVLLNPLAK
jgi:membrane fusion protein (multidrug efflux system)